MTCCAARFLALLLLLAAAGGAWATSLRDVLLELSDTHGFEVRNIERVGDETPVATSGSLPQRLSALLAKYNHVLFYDVQGRVERVIVSSRKGPPPEFAREVAISTRRKGPHHVVDAVLLGDNGVPRRVELVVDTGATTIVLPVSMLRSLGLDADSLEIRTVSTANGEAVAMLGRLRSVDVGGLAVNDVEVVFIPDKKLGQQRLLGMSFLRRFRVTLDESKGGLILGVE